MDLKNNLLSIIRHYGVIPQLKYFQTEVFELNEAIINYEKDYANLDVQDMAEDEKHIAEEIADVLVMLMQFVYHYDLKLNKIEEVFNYKIERQLKRIENEVEKNN